MEESVSTNTLLILLGLEESRQTAHGVNRLLRSLVSHGVGPRVCVSFSHIMCMASSGHCREAHTEISAAPYTFERTPRFPQRQGFGFSVFSGG